MLQFVMYLLRRMVIVVKTRNQVKDIPVHQERVFSFVAILLFYNTKVRIKSDKQKNVAKLLADRRFRKMA